VGRIAQKTGFGLVSPLPGIRPVVAPGHRDHAAGRRRGLCGVRAAAPGWRETQLTSGRTRRFAKWSAICSFALGMAGRVAYHLMAQAGMARASPRDDAAGGSDLRTRLAEPRAHRQQLAGGRQPVRSRSWHDRTNPSGYGLVGDSSR
jgi:hypothetical protein